MSDSSAPLHFELAPRRACLRFVGAAFMVALLATAGCSEAQDASVSIESARAELEAGRITLIDVREPAEHAAGVARGAHLLPMSQIKQRIAEIPKDPGQAVLLICNTQNRSHAVWKALQDNGYTNVRYVKGGMSEWARRGWPLIRPGS
jgi:rhodanese-related sulfurtransferase